MKKIFSMSVLILLLLSTIQSAYADINDILKISYEAFKATDDYSDLVNSHSYESAKKRLDIYRKISDVLRDLRVRLGSLSRYEAECLALTRLVVLNRTLTLDYYVSAVDAHRGNNIALYNEYLSKLYEQAEQAFSSRRTFKNKYGF